MSIPTICQPLVKVPRRKSTGYELAYPTPELQNPEDLSARMVNPILGWLTIAGTSYPLRYASLAHLKDICSVVREKVQTIFS